jgi:hypothetical protein
MIDFEYQGKKEEIDMLKYRYRDFEIYIFSIRIQQIIFVCKYQLATALKPFVPLQRDAALAPTLIFNIQCRFEARYFFTVQKFSSSYYNQGCGSGLTYYGSGSSIFSQSGSGSKLKQNF